MAVIIRPLCMAALAAVLSVTLSPAPEAADGLRLTGQMESFQLTPARRPPPDARWASADGDAVSLADFKGRVVLVNFWASWCAPCIRELPSLDRLEAALGGQEFTVVAINVDRGGRPVANRMVRRLDLRSLTLYLNRDSSAARALGVRAMPTSLVFDRQGRELGKLEGAAEWDTPEAQALIRYFIERPGYADTLPEAD